MLGRIKAIFAAHMCARMQHRYALSVLGLGVTMFSGGFQGGDVVKAEAEKVRWKISLSSPFVYFSWFPAFFLSCLELFCFDMGKAYPRFGFLTDIRCLC